MNVNNILLFKGEDENEINKILFRHDGNLIATLYCDKTIEFNGRINLNLLEKIQIVSESFDLFYNNI